MQTQQQQAQPSSFQAQLHGSTMRKQQDVVRHTSATAHKHKHSSQVFNHNCTEAPCARNKTLCGTQAQLHTSTSTALKFFKRNCTEAPCASNKTLCGTQAQLHTSTMHKQQDNIHSITTFHVFSMHQHKIAMLLEHRARRDYAQQLKTSHT